MQLGDSNEDLLRGTTPERGNRHMQLVYKPKPGFSAPGNSWPTSNHEEKNAKVAQAKLDSGFYREKGKRVSKPGTTPPKSTKNDTRRGSTKKGDA